MAEEKDEFDYREERKEEWRNRALECVKTIIENKAVDDDEVVVRDTLCNLMHWCDEHDVDFDQELVTAHMNFEAECEDTE